jgi:hypothetical protein
MTPRASKPRLIILGEKMHLLDIKKQVVNLYETRKALHLVGPPGVGKTDVVREDFVKILSDQFGEQFGFHDCMVPTYDAPDFRGFLIPTKDEQGKPTSFFTRSAAMPSRSYLEKHPRGIMFMDERNQADALTQKALAPVVLEKRFGEETLPDGWWVVSASNRVADGSGVNKALKHLINRERIVQVEPAILPWALWAEERGIHPMLIAFAKHRPGIVFSDTVPKEDAPFCTPRSYVSAAKLLSLVAGVDKDGQPNMKIPNDQMVIQLVSGDIGENAAAELFAFLKVVDELPTIEEIQADPKGCKCPKELSAAYAGAQMLIHYAEPSNIDKLWIFAERLAKELQVSTAKSLIEKGGGKLLNSKALNTWIMANKTLIVASSAK